MDVALQYSSGAAMRQGVFVVFEAFCCFLFNYNRIAPFSSG
jgi:hypothetical protein